MPNECDWGRSCNCSECTPQLEDLCEICEKKPGWKVGSTLRKDRKGCKYYEFQTCCRDCYQEEHGQYEDARFNLFLRLLEMPPPPPPPFLKTWKEIKSCLKSMFSSEFYHIEKYIKYWFERLDYLKVKITWQKECDNDIDTFDSGDVKFEGRNGSVWFESVIEPKIYPVIKKSQRGGGVRITKVKLDSTTSKIPAQQETAAEARRREWCRTHL